jgi:hypothetical protein
MCGAQGRPRTGPARLALALLAVAGCDLAYPEVVVVNRTADTLLLRNPSFSGCVWHVVLANGAATSPRRCLPGGDRIHFQRLDAEAYCRDRLADCTLPGATACDAGSEPDAGPDAEPPGTEPIWFNYQTISAKHVAYGGFYRLEVTVDDMEQDFCIPGPYGH